MLPRWVWLARLARLPGVLPVLDVAYAVFLQIRPLWRRSPQAFEALPRALKRELRTDHAGETGAVMIYRGILAVSRDAAVCEFARHHLATEQRHLEAMQQRVPGRWRSKLLLLWRLSGWLTGALAAVAGPRATYATIEAVETFVDRHYAVQIHAIDALLQNPHRQTQEAMAMLHALRVLLEDCRLDELSHRDDAAARGDGHGGLLLGLWCRVVGWGSAVAVGICRYV